MDYVPATEDDKSYLRELNRRVYEPVVVRQFGEWDDELQSTYFEAKWLDQEFLIVWLDGRRIGALWTSTLDGAVWLREIQIEPCEQGNGIGTELVSFVVEQADAQNRDVVLRVLHANEARRLYARLGFVETDRTEAHLWMKRLQSVQT